MVRSTPFGLAPAQLSVASLTAPWRWPCKTAPRRGLALIDAINKEGELADYQWVHSTKADLYRRLGRIPEALEAYGKALEMSQLEPEKRFLQRRIQELKK